ncbi:histidinol-phosphate transaminase [Helicobacter sp. 16-1353]|uniref:histidinol-phosphate transaminase n=1 Tax=Helicobacter sp. 16-1353 TaxID=2004996 RepID=UPI000DCC7927|nr:histidinol-phosphate transaminase [Helicobacter sp. 16-1353]RAX54492.1 histidinol-phosphate transaminase [Helicobacter sp. 16-1353]
MGFKKHLEKLVSYEAGKPIELVVRDYGIKPKGIIKLASNENPLGTSKKVQNTIKKEVKNAFRYPDDSMFELKNALAKKYNVESSNIIIGSGSDQIIEFIIQSIASKDSKILISSATFAMYEIYAKIAQAQIIKTKDGIHIADEFIEAYQKHKPDIIFLCVPNNPLGDCLDKAEVYRILDSISKDCLVVLDSAYGEFAAYRDKNKALNPSEIIKKYKNCIYLGTFSKLYGLGGLRVGFGIGESGVIKILHKLRPPFNITNISLKAALSALNDTKFIQKTLKNNLQEMKIYENFARKNNINFIESYTNFITFIFDKKVDSSSLCEFLLKKGVIIRDLKSYGLNAVRITIGKESQNKKVLKLITKFLKN